MTGGRVNLPFLPEPRTSDLDGDPSPRLEAYREAGPFTVDEDTIEEHTNPDFAAPAKEQR